MIGTISAVIGLGVASIIIWLIRRDHLHVNHGLSWLLVALVFAFLGFAPATIDQLAIRVGVAYPPTLALALGIVLLTIKILLMDIERSQLEMHIQRLTQRMAITEAELEQLKAASDTENDANKTTETAKQG